MRPNKHSRIIVPSILDRLIDLDPMSSVDDPMTVYQQVSVAKENIRRDLENLLNTRLRIDRNLDDLNELTNSIVNYGLPDFSHLPVQSEEECLELAHRVKAIIYRFEPRLTNIEVTIEPSGEGINRTLYVEISATFHIEPDPVSVFFDSRLNHIDRKLSLREARYGR